MLAYALPLPALPLASLPSPPLPPPPSLSTPFPFPLALALPSPRPVFLFPSSLPSSLFFYRPLCLSCILFLSSVSPPPPPFFFQDGFDRFKASTYITEDATNEDPINSKLKSKGASGVSIEAMQVSRFFMFCVAKVVCG